MYMAHTAKRDSRIAVPQLNLTNPRLDCVLTLAYLVVASCLFCQFQQMRLMS